MSRTSALQVAPGSAQALSPQQKKFNSLLQRLGKQRDLLGEWEAAIAVFRQRYVAELLPLQEQERSVKQRLLRVLDQRSEQKLAKADREHLQLMICAYVDEILPYIDDEAELAALKAIFNRHAAVDYDTEQAEMAREQEAEARAMLEGFFGIELDEDETATPEVLVQRLSAQMEQQAQAAAEASAGKRSKKPSKRELQQQEAAKQVSQSLREIYRKLASSLHPDRETDPLERERKTALMQRVNQAYEGGQLLQLLELQLEVEHIDTAHIAGLSEERLKHYNQVLSEQLRDLQQEVQMVEHRFLREFDMSPYERHSPKKIGKFLSEEVVDMREYLEDLSDILQALSDEPDMFKRWLKGERELQRQHDRALRETSFQFYY